MISASEQKIYAKLADLETEISALRDGYMLVNQRYADTLASMKTLTALTLEAALRSASAAEKSAQASQNAAQAASAALAERRAASSVRAVSVFMDARVSAYRWLTSM